MFSGLVFACFVKEKKCLKLYKKKKRCFPIKKKTNAYKTIIFITGALLIALDMENILNSKHSLLPPLKVCSCMLHCHLYTRDYFDETVLGILWREWDFFNVFNSELFPGLTFLKSVSIIQDGGKHKMGVAGILKHLGQTAKA